MSLSQWGEGRNCETRKVVKRTERVSSYSSKKLEQKSGRRPRRFVKKAMARHGKRCTFKIALQTKELPETETTTDLRSEETLPRGHRIHVGWKALKAV